MGEHITKRKSEVAEQKAFVEHLINDIKALELMLERGMFENDVIRIGAEQELCLVDQNFQPAGINQKLLERIDDPHFTDELASYNMEINLDPFVLREDCFSKTETQLLQLLKLAHARADDLGVKILMTGILPTISKNEVSMDFVTPIPRYFALNDALKACKGGDFNLKIRGVDELSLKHDSVLFEACNTSFQLHLQVASTDFIPSYNWAQAIAGPVLATACNSPILLGRELWKETRIALFQQSLDTRKSTYALRDQTPRVGFGTDWEQGSVAEIFKEDISKHRVLLSKPIKESSLVQLDKGKIPKLDALRLHNGTVYRWNRPCYGIGNGKPHLRIENRYLPSGPSVIDELANFALWVGLMMGRPKTFDDMPAQMDFKAAKANFIKAARTGIETVFVWKDQQLTAKELLRKELLPIAYSGLQKSAVAKEDIERLLGVIEARAEGTTGAQWQINSLRTLRKQMKTDLALNKLTEVMYLNQGKGLPVNNWPEIQTKQQTRKDPKWVKEIMSTHLLKLNEDDFASMAAAIMEWNNIHHIPIENDKGELTGLLTWNYLESLDKTIDINTIKVSEIMITEIKSVSPRTEIKEAKQMLSEYNIGCLPVCSGKTLVGILSTRDL